MSHMSKSNHPYSDLESRAFWRNAIATRNPLEIEDLWRPKFEIERQDKVSTYGSCFAQHIGRSLRARNFSWLITENFPDGLIEQDAAASGYGMFSSRTANIYTSSLLRQWISWAAGVTSPPDEYWESDGRFYDPFRPAIEVGGFESRDEMVSLRSHTIDCFRQSITDADFFVFTMGLTESWFNKAGFEYPVCPGTIAGNFNFEEHKFLNQDYEFILDAMRSSISSAKELNPNLKFILTVSPVPLTATASGNHVLVATMQSKSVLRAVAGKLADERDDVDYFPSYEIINSAPFGGMFFEPNKRSVARAGVNFVMDSFFKGFAAKDYEEDKAGSSFQPIPSPLAQTAINHDVGCEEAMLEVYAR